MGEALDQSRIGVLFLPAAGIGRARLANRGHRRSRPAGHDVLDVLTGDLGGGLLVKLVFLAQRPQVFAFLALFLRIGARLLKFVVMMAFCMRCTINLMRVCVSAASNGKAPWRTFATAPASPSTSTALAGR